MPIWKTWRTTWHTRASELPSVAGGALGFRLLIGLSMAGIGALLQASVHALLVLKLPGTR